jgi:hypothetical protein
MIVPFIDPDGKLTVKILPETHCAQILSVIRRVLKIEDSRFTSDGVRGVVAYDDGIKYEITVKPLEEKA